MTKKKIAKILSVLICILYLSAPIFAFSTTSEQHPKSSTSKLLFQNSKKEFVIAFSELEDDDEETDFEPIYALHSLEPFIQVNALGEVSSNLFFSDLSVSNRHLPLWLSYQHIIQ